MRRLVPTSAPVGLGDAYAGLSLPAAPWLAIGMVTSLDGAVAIEGRSRALGGSGDLAAFRALRALADVIMVGAGTVVQEAYGASWPVRHAGRRAAAGQESLPGLAIISGSGVIDADARVLEGDRPPTLVTTPAGAEAATAAGLPVEVIVVPATPDGQVELVAAVEALRARFGPRVACEGGPTLNAGLLSAGLVDELFVTIAPQLVGASGPGIVGILDDGALPGGVDLTLHELRVHASELVCRYRVRVPGYGPDADRRG